MFLKKNSGLMAMFALLVLACSQGKADELKQPSDDGNARPVPYFCRCGESCTCLHCGCYDPCLPRPWPKPVPLPGPSGPCPWPKPWPNPYPWLKIPLDGMKP